MPDASSAEIRAAIRGVGSSLVNSLPADTKAAVLDAIIGAMSKAYIGVIAAGAFTIILSLFLKRERLFLEPEGKNSGNPCRERGDGKKDWALLSKDDA